MKTIFAILMAILFLFSSCEQPIKKVAEKTKARSESVVVSKNYTIDSVKVNTLPDGKKIQTVYIAGGEELLFSEDAMSINDLDLRENYLTYRNIKQYKEARDALVRLKPKLDSNIADFICFNTFLKEQGLKLLSEEEYKTNIQKEITFEKYKGQMDKATIALWSAVGVLIIILLVGIIIFLRSFILLRKGFIYAPKITDNTA